jgi:hypothetical protein
MTRKEFNARSRAALKAFARDVKRVGEEDARRRWREEDNLIYVRTYTVQAHFRPRRNRRSK